MRFGLIWGWLAILKFQTEPRLVCYIWGEFFQNIYGKKNIFALKWLLYQRYLTARLMYSDLNHANQKKQCIFCHVSFSINFLEDIFQCNTLHFHSALINFTFNQKLFQRTYFCGWIFFSQFLYSVCMCYVLEGRVHSSLQLQG